MAHILLVEDNIQLAEATRDFLQLQGHDVTVNHGEGVVEQVLTTRPDLLILDVELPNETGFSICRRLRESYPQPILLLTAHTTELDEVVGLEMGADDFVRKPVDPMVLALRVRAALRTTGDAPSDEPAADDAYVDPHITVDAERRAVRVSGELVELTTAEFELARFLVARVGTPAPREAYFVEVRGIPYDGIDRTYDNTVSKLRRKLEAAGLPPTRIVTVRGVGYQLTRA